MLKSALGTVQSRERQDIGKMLRQFALMILGANLIAKMVIGGLLKNFHLIRYTTSLVSGTTMRSLLQSGLCSGDINTCRRASKHRNVAVLVA